MQPITEIFKQFCKERHAEDKSQTKGKNFNLLQEVYANTELFDISLYDFSKDTETCKGSQIIKRDNTRSISFITNKEVCLPFQNNFIKCEKEGSYIFIREYEPQFLTGSMYTQYKFLKGNLPFAVKLFEDKQIVITTDITPLLKTGSKVIIDHLEEMAENLFVTIISALSVVSNLSNKSVVTDNYTNPNQKIEYFRRKHLPTIKVPSKPIYYILGEKSENVSPKYKSIQSRGHTEYSYSFSVRGHWRRISDKTYGKDRQGNYTILGHTWVTEYIKGEGELTKRLRVIKN